MMDSLSTLATGAYRHARDLLGPGGMPSPDSLVQGVQGFSDVLRQAEKVAGQVMTDQASPHALVEAITAAEFAMETVVTVRDKVVEAYQEILRMPV